MTGSSATNATSPPPPGTLDAYLDLAGAEAGPAGAAAARVVRAMAEAGREIAALLAAIPLRPELAATVEDRDGGDPQKALDLRADAVVREALARHAPSDVAAYASEEMEEPVALTADAPLAVAADPLDGSSNIATNAPVGTIFSVLPAVPSGDALAHFLQPGSRQVCAGFLIYGPHTALALAFAGGETRVFVLDPGGRGFLAAPGGPCAVPPRTREYAINASNSRHWDLAVRDYVGDLLRGADGPRGADFNTRWVASMVADAYRVLGRGGVYLYPGDRRRGYERGRLRLVYEGNPVALLMERAGGAATDGRRRILGLTPAGVHERVPLVFGSREEVERVAAHQGGAAKPGAFRVGPHEDGARAHGQHVEVPAA